jgi:hypothetical protein
MKFIILLILYAFSASYAQELTRTQLDSLYNLYLRIKMPVETEAPLFVDTSGTKCGFGTVNLVRFNYENFTPEQQIILQKIFARPVTQKNIISPRGWFRIHYDTSGTNAIRYDLNQLLEAADSSYSYQVLTLGYPTPRGSISGEGPYDIYVQNISDYGYTEFEDNIPGTPTYTSFIVIDNDFTHTPTRGINGARVTVAHEIHHAIQIGHYAFKENDIYYHELSSTAMEEFVFDTINDYYFYLDDYFDFPDLSFPLHSGYDLAIWNIYLEDIFDHKLLRRQWELIPNNRALDAVSLSLGERNSSFQEIFNRFGIWVYFTGHRKIPGRYFREGAFYPLVDNTLIKPFIPPKDSLVLYGEPVSHNFITLTVSVPGGRDTVTILFSNSDFKRANTDPNSVEMVLYEFTNDSTLGLNRLTDGYYQRFTAANPTFWTTSEFINNQLVREGLIRIDAESPYPNPFRYSAHALISIPVVPGTQNEIELVVYSASMDLVYSSRRTLEVKFGKEIVSWNGRNNDNQKLGSGIYIYVIKSGDDFTKGKIVIFND